MVRAGAHGIRHPFYDWKTRYGMLEEGLEIIKALWTEDNVTFKGQHYTPGRGYVLSQASSVAPPTLCDRRKR